MGKTGRGTRCSALLAVMTLAACATSPGEGEADGGVRDAGTAGDAGPSADAGFVRGFGGFLPFFLPISRDYLATMVLDVTYRRLQLLDVRDPRRGYLADWIAYDLRARAVLLNGFVLVVVHHPRPRPSSPGDSLSATTYRVVDGRFQVASDRTLLVNLGPQMELVGLVANAEGAVVVTRNEFIRVAVDEAGVPSMGQRMSIPLPLRCESPRCFRMTTDGLVIDAADGVRIWSLDDDTGTATVRGDLSGVTFPTNHLYYQADRNLLFTEGGCHTNPFRVFDLSDPSSPRQAAAWDACAAFSKPIYVNNGPFAIRNRLFMRSQDEIFVVDTSGDLTTPHVIAVFDGAPLPPYATLMSFAVFEGRMYVNYKDSTVKLPEVPVVSFELSLLEP